MKDEIKYSLLTLKPNRSKISENPKKNFDKITDVLMSFHLFPYFGAFEAKELGKINIHLYNAFVRYYERIYDKEIPKYNLDIPKKEEFDTNKLYAQKDDKGHFIKLKLLQMEHYLLFSYFDWTWKNDDRYWLRKTPKNSILNKEVCHLKEVCLVDINAKMSHIFPGKYKLYLNHCVCGLGKEVLKLTVEIEGIVYKELDYPTKEQKDNCHHDKNSLFKQYITDIDVAYNENLDKEGGPGHEIAIKFNNKDWYWKNNWSIDAAILERNTDIYNKTNSLINLINSTTNEEKPKEKNHGIQRIKYSLTLKSNRNKISDQAKKNFDKITDVLMSFHLFPYFRAFEAKELGKINIHFYNAFVRYYERIYDKEIPKYNLEIPKKEEFDTNKLYAQKDDKGHFIKLKLLQMEHYLLFSYFDWTWKNDYRYWLRKTPKNSILNKEICHLKEVCLVDINAKMSHIFPGKYKLYLNHCVCGLGKEVLKLTVEIEGIAYKELDYPTKEQKDNCHHDDNSLFKQYITDIDVAYNENLDKEGGPGHEIAVKFNNKDWFWKYNWSIDAAILIRVLD